MAAGIWCRRLGLSPLVLERGPEVGGQLLNLSNPIVDYPGFPMVTGRALRDHLLAHATAVGVHIRCGVEVQAVDIEARLISTTEGDLHYDKLIIATGARPRRLGVEGEAEMLARGECYSATRHAHLFCGQPVVVVGGGDGAAEAALRLAAAGALVTLVHRSTRFRARPNLLTRLRTDPRIRIWSEATVARILGDKRVEAVEVLCVSQRFVVPAAAVFIRIGVEPASHWLAGVVRLTPTGRVWTDCHGQTSQPGVWAIGDVASEPPHSSIVVAMAQGMMAAKHIALDASG